MKGIFFLALTVGILGASAWAGYGLAGVAAPSERSCLIAWNQTSNAAGHRNLIAGGPWRVGSLRPAVTVTADRRGSTATPKPACVLLVARQREFRVITGAWQAGSVRRWRFGELHRAATAPRYGNVRVLADGRVTRLSR